MLQEGSTGIVQLEEEDEIHVRAMIEYLYTFQYHEAEGDDLELCISHDPTEEHTYGMSFPGSLSPSSAVRYYKETVRGNFTKQSCLITQYLSGLRNADFALASGCKLWPFALSIAMHVLGDKYDIEGLTDYARTKVDQILRYSEFTPVSYQCISRVSTKTSYHRTRLCSNSHHNLEDCQR